MHQAWGLGVPLLATPFHLVGRLFGAPGFPDSVRFLLCYAAVTIVLARVLHQGTARTRAGLLVAAEAVRPPGS